MGQLVDVSFSLISFEHFLLILVRISLFVFVAPFFSLRGIPNLTKIGFSAILSIMILAAIDPTEVTYGSTIQYGILVVKEAMTGVLLGYATYICNSILLFAGNIIDMDIGLSMVSQFDPSMNTQVTVTGNLYFYFFMMMLLATNGHQFIIRALCDSFSLIPLGGAIFEWDVLLPGMVSFFTNLILIAFRIMLPIFSAILVMNVVLGIMAKVAPQMHIFSIGVQLKIIVGFVILMVMVTLFPQVVTLVVDQMRLNLRNFTEGMI